MGFKVVTKLVTESLKYWEMLRRLDVEGRATAKELSLALSVSRQWTHLMLNQAIAAKEVTKEGLYYVRVSYSPEQAMLAIQASLEAETTAYHLALHGEFEEAIVKARRLISVIETLQYAKDNHGQ